MTKEQQKKIALVEINDSLHRYDSAISHKNNLLNSSNCGPDSKDWNDALNDCVSKSSDVLAKIDFAKKLDLIDFDEYLSYQNLFTDIMLKKGSD